MIGDDADGLTKAECDVQRPFRRNGRYVVDAGSSFFGAEFMGAL
jgi:hypothetical protein